MARRRARNSDQTPASSIPEERVDVLCGCGWGRLRCPISEVPSACPICGMSFDREIVVEEDEEFAENPTHDPTHDQNTCWRCFKPAVSDGLCRRHLDTRIPLRVEFPLGRAGRSERQEYAKWKIDRGASNPAECCDCGGESEAGHRQRDGLCRTCYRQRRVSRQELEQAREEDTGRGRFSGRFTPGLLPEEVVEIDSRIDREWRGNPLQADSRRVEFPRRRDWWTRRNAGHAGDIVGWTYDAAVYCTEHKPQRPYRGDRPAPLLDVQDEGWEDMTCDECGELLGDVEGIVSNPRGRSRRRNTGGHECPSDGRDQRGRCVGQCSECGEHGLVTGRYTSYCPSCQTCESCGCPDADGFSHYQGCALARAAESAVDRVANPRGRRARNSSRPARRPAGRSSRRAGGGAVIVEVDIGFDDSIDDVMADPSATDEQIDAALAGFDPNRTFEVRKDVEEILERAGLPTNGTSREVDGVMKFFYGVPGTHNPSVVADALKKFFRGQSDVRVSVS